MENNMSRAARRQSAPVPNGQPPRPRKRRKKWRWIAAILLLLVIVGGVMMSMVLSNVKTSVDKMYRSAKVTKARDVQEVLKKGEPFFDSSFGD